MKPQIVRRVDSKGVNCGQIETFSAKKAERFKAEARRQGYGIETEPITVADLIETAIIYLVLIAIIVGIVAGIVALCRHIGRETPMEKWEQKSYTIGEGDTLWSIAEELGVKAELRSAWSSEVQKLNPSLEPRYMQIGDEIIILVPPTED